MTMMPEREPLEDLLARTFTEQLGLSDVTVVDTRTERVLAPETRSVTVTGFPSKRSGRSFEGVLVGVGVGVPESSETP